MALLGSIVVALVGLILAPGFSFYFDITPKLVVLLVGAAALLLALMWDAQRQPIPKPQTSKGTAPHVLFFWLLLFSLLSLALSTALSVRPDLSLFGSNWRRYGSITQGCVLAFSALVVLVCSGRPERVRVMLRGLVFCGGLTSLYGIAQYFGWDPFLPAAAYHTGEGIGAIVRPPGTFGYASYFATWLSMIVFLSLALRPLEESAVWRKFAAATAVLAGIAMFLTGTRAAIVGLVAGALIWAVLEKPRIPKRAWLWPAIAVLAAAGFYYSPAGTLLRGRAHWFADDPWGGARARLWRDTLSMATRKLPAGYGPEVFTAQFPHYESEGLAQAYPSFSHESPHNIFLDALVAQGLPGLLALMGLCALPFLPRGPLLDGRSSVASLFRAALLAGIVGQQFTAFTIPTAVVFFTALALLLSLESPQIMLRRRIPASVAATALASVLVFLAIRLALADHALVLTQRAVDRGDLHAAANDYRTYEHYRLPGGTADLWYSRAALGIAVKITNLPEKLWAATESSAAAVRATQTAEDPFNAWYNLAVVEAFLDDGKRAEVSLRATIAAHPRWFKPHWTLARILRLQGRANEARQEARLAAELDGGQDAEVLQTAQELTAQQLQR